MKNSPETLKKRNKLKRKWKETTDINSFKHSIQRKCKSCGEIKPCRWASSFTQTGTPEYRARCDECHNDLSRKRNKINRNRRSLLAKVRRLKRKRKCVDYMGGECVKCGYKKCMRALTFHHLFNKSKEISMMLDSSWLKLKKELDKCELLCFNCHMEAHSHEVYI